MKRGRLGETGAGTSLQCVAIAAAVVVASGVLGAGTTLRAQTTIAARRSEPVEVRRVVGTIDIDGRLDDSAWLAAAPVSLPWEIQPADNAAARVSTDCRVAFDDEQLYFGCRADDPRPDLIRAFMIERDETDGQDAIGLMIDPFQDQRRSFAFSVTPLGVQSDFIFGQGEGNPAWDAIWESQARVTEEGYVVEAAIPFKSLRFPATAEVQSWNFFFWRVWPRSQSVSLRSVPLDKSNQCALCQLATMSGFQGIEPSRNVEVTPTLTAQRSDQRELPADPGLSTGAVDDQYGLDLRWSVTSDLTLNATVNPDFSQVEADEIQIQSNQQFALFFPERRPFFLEGAEFYQTPLRAVFTRSIADPSFGTKVSGKVGGWAVGALVARDETTNLLIPAALSSESATLDQRATTVLGRARRDVGSSGTVGGLLTSREGAGYHNRVAGLDASLQLTGPLNLTAQLLGSETVYPLDSTIRGGTGGEPLRGAAGIARLDFGTRDWFGWAFVEGLHSDFRADAGFIPSVDYRGYNWRLQRKWWLESDSWLTRVAVLGGAGQRDDWDGNPLYRFVFGDLNLQGPWQSELVLNPDYFERVFGGRRFRISRLNVFGGVQPHARLEGGWLLQFGEELDYANARESGLVRLGPWLDVRVGSGLDLQFDYTYKRLTYAGARVFREQIGSARVVYYLSRRAFLRGVVQVRDLARDPAQYVDPVSPGDTRLATQLLFSYTLNPQSVVFLGYADRSIDDRENADPTSGLVQMGRTFFLKLSYAWRP